MAKGIKSIIGEKNPKVGESYIYEVSSYYPNTPRQSNNIQWKLYVMQNNGSWRELRGPLKTGTKVPFQLPEKWLGKKMMIEAFIYNPEKKSPPGLIITPIQAKIPEIKKVELRYHNNSPGTVFSFSDKLIAQATCVNLFNKELTATLWEDDTAGNGHHNKNNIIKSVKSKVDENGIAKAEFLLTEALIKKALEGEIDVKQIEFYVTFEYYAHKKHATNNIHVDNPISENPSPPLNPKADPPVDKTPPDAVPSKDNIPEDSTPPEAVPKQDPVISTPENTSDSEQPTTSAQTNGTIENTQPPAPPESATSPAVVNDANNEVNDHKCVCKDEYKLIWGNKLTCSQRKKVVEICKSIWGEDSKIDKANDLMAIMHLETDATFSPSKKGVSKSGTSFIGLIQFSANTAKTLNTTYSALGKMSFNEQMVYVEKYLRQNKDKMTTIVDFYLQVLKPSDVGKGNNKNHIVFDESVSVPDGDGSNTSSDQRKININIEPWVTKYGYASNPKFMVENNEKVKRSRWVYTRQVYEERYGTIGGKTYIWEIEKILRNEHYEPGKNNRYSGVCEDNPVEKKESNGKYPPWVDVAIREEVKIIREATHCEYIKNTYHASTDNAKMSRCGSEKDSTRSNSAWCGAFVAYCLKTSGHKYQPDPGAIWHGKENLVKRLKGVPYETQEKWGKKHSQMYIGGIVEWHNNGHTTIIVGIDKSDHKNYILLGGNQDDGVRFWTSLKSKVQPFCIFPVDYEGELLPLELIEPSDLSPNAIKYKEGSTS